MKKVILILAFAYHAALSCLLAQEKFNVYSYALPSGFTSQEVQGSLVFTSADGKLSILMVPVKTSTDDFYTAFGKEWERLVSSRYSVLGFPNRKGTDFSDGWYMTTGQSKVSDGKQTFWIQLRNFTKADRMATLVFFAEDENQQGLISEFIRGTRLSEKPVSTEKTVETKKAVSPPESVDGIKGNIEIWMRIKAGSFNMSNDYYSGNYYDLSKNRMAYKVLFPDGTYTGDELPYEGLLNFSASSPNASEYTWGKYAKSEKQLHLKSQYEDLTLEFKSPDILENANSSFPYYRCKPVDGVKLNGSWSYIPDSEKDPYYDEPGCRQVIFFGNDGSFVDRGVFVSDCRYPDRYPEDAPGKGTYQIRKFTMILSYDDGRTRYKSFTGALMNDPFVRDEIIYIGRIAFFKRNRK